MVKILSSCNFRMNNLKRMVKAAFFDIDGTLAPYDTRRISQSDCETIEALCGQGTLIFIATGRHISDIDNIPFPVNGAVCNNGAMSYIVKEGCAHFYERDRFELIDHHPIPERQAIEIARLIMANHIPSAVVTSKRPLFCNLTSRALEFMRSINMPEPREGDAFESIDNDRIYTFCPFVSPEEEKLIFKDALAGLDTSRWCNVYLDINVHGVDKVLGMRNILDACRISPKDVIAFGDGFNDVEMLKFAGCGIAMGTADDEVKRVADFVTSSANDSGVSKWLLSFLG